MNSSFIWIVLAVVLFLVYSVWVLRRTRQHSKFQARLSVLFFLFMLLPIIPLIMLFSSLFIKSSNLMAPPGIETALNLSLDIMRASLEDKGRQFFQEHPDLDLIDLGLLQSFDADYLLVWQQPEKPGISLFKPDMAEFKKQFINMPARTLLDSSQTFLRDLGDHTVFEYHTQLTGKEIACIGFRVDPEMLFSIQQINQLSRNYNTFRLLKDTVLEKNMIWVFSLGLSILLAFISFQAAKSVSRGLSGPILDLTEGMKKVGEGDLGHQVSNKAKDEIGFLIGSFNRMTGELRVNRENLKKAERAAAWRDVARQISHEIKNPLTPIELSLYRLKKSVQEENPAFMDVQASTKIIEEEITSIRALANSFSEFAKMPGLRLEKVQIADIITGSVELYRNYPVHFQTQPDIPSVHIDREQIRRALNNLIKNAIEASPDKQPIEIILGHSDDADHPVKIEIIDQGTGIKPEDLKKIKKPYFTTKKEGTGLGLFIVNRIINEHGGTMTIKSSLGQGTRIEIII